MPPAAQLLVLEVHKVLQVDLLELLEVLLVVPPEERLPLALSPSQVSLRGTQAPPTSCLPARGSRTSIPLLLLAGIPCPSAAMMALSSFPLLLYSSY